MIVINLYWCGDGFHDNCWTAVEIEIGTVVWDAGPTDPDWALCGIFTAHTNTGMSTGSMQTANMGDLRILGNLGEHGDPTKCIIARIERTRAKHNIRIEMK
jgi:hypothetical protein